MKRAFPFVLASLIMASSAYAQPVPVPVMSTEEVGGYMGIGAELETRIDGDLNGDGEIDTVFIERGEDNRTLTVMLAYREETDMGHEAKGVLELDAYPLGAATLTIKKGVLVIEDLTGGTTAINATYRYRYDPATSRMRLIGLDAKQYSRTNAHGWSSMSWNLLNGDFVRQQAALHEGPGDAAYDNPVSKTTKRQVKAIYMEETPSPEDVLSD